VCEECIGEKESCALVEKLNYQNEDIQVYLVRGKEAPKSIREASAAVPVPDRRTSKRSRRTTSGNSISLKVSGSTTVYQLKLMIWESLGV
ncbi:Os03g0192900, partial [Oryza sativa Japonica Group]